MTDSKKPDIQLIANLVAVNPAGEVLLVRYNPEDDRWWLPGGDLEPYQHPEEAARKVIEELEGVEIQQMSLADVESFRGRRGWHIVFNYRVEVLGDASGKIPVSWHAPDRLPRTVHGKWEKQAVERVLAG
ncbi:MAG: NUDIX hydrolase [Planctomycetes bacterium]|nr:NUDIX hydrolase [Planctomycetota bacterium]